MIVNVYTFKDGIQTFNEVTAIRIKSKDYNLLILKDYLAIVGEIDGDIEIETVDGKTLYDKVKEIHSCAFAGLTETEKVNYATSIFGKNAYAGMLAIINASEDDFNKLTSA